MKQTTNILIICASILIFTFCHEAIDPVEEAYVAKIEKHRKDYNEYMSSNPASPFHYKGEVEFHELNYFDVDMDFRFKSKLYRYEKQDTITVYGTKGEPRRTVKYGYVQFNYEGKRYQINVYQGNTRSGDHYYSIWFTDKTTNDESYGVGRYLNFDKKSDKDYLYEIDFNLAYNPYCAYSKEYSCAIPTKEDYIDLAVKAGEKIFHN